MQISFNQRDAGTPTVHDNNDAHYSKITVWSQKLRDTISPWNTLFNLVKAALLCAVRCVREENLHYKFRMRIIGLRRIRCHFDDKFSNRQFYQLRLILLLLSIDKRARLSSVSYTNHVSACHPNLMRLLIKYREYETFVSGESSSTSGKRLQILFSPRNENKYERDMDEKTIMM